MKAVLVILPIAAVLPLWTYGSSSLLLGVMPPGDPSISLVAALVDKGVSLGVMGWMIWWFQGKAKVLENLVGSFLERMEKNTVAQNNASNAIQEMRTQLNREFDAIRKSYESIRLANSSGDDGK